MDDLQTKLQKLLKFDQQIYDLHISPTAIESLKKIIQDVKSYLRTFGEQYESQIEWLNDDMLSINTSRQLGWKHGTKGASYFDACKKDVRFTLSNIISGVRDRIEKG